MSQAYMVKALVCAGFPSPAEDYMEQPLDLNEKLIKHPSATFMVRVSGNSMIGAGIHHGDLILIDRSLEAQHRNVVLAILNGEFTLKRLIKAPNGRLSLHAENSHYKPIHITEEMDFSVWGVATQVIHALR
jgi:DNA polymerase V